MTRSTPLSNARRTCSRVAIAMLLAVGTGAPGRAQSAPQILIQPAAQSAVVGARTFFSVGATSDEPLDHRWRKDGVTITEPRSTAVHLTNHLWRYNQTGANLGTSWRAADYNDSLWPIGAGVFAVENNPVITALTRTVLSLTGSTGNPVITYYFRTTFVLTNEATPISLVTSNYFDDGAAVYLNGTAVFRFNIPVGPLNADTHALGTTPEGVPFVINLPPSLLVPGTNTLAVEVHQISLISSDVVFGMELTTIGPTEVLTLDNVQLSTAGEYSVQVSNSTGVATSGNATLTVRGPRGGDIDHAFDFGSDLGERSVTVIAVQADGKVLIGGSFTTVGGVPRRRLARLNADLTLDTGFLPHGGGADANVRAIAIQPDGRILISGDFSSIDRISRSRVARLNLDGSVDPDFDPLPLGAVSCILPQPDGRILIAGFLPPLHGKSFPRIARLNSDGSLDPSFVQSIDLSIVNSMALQPDGKVILGCSEGSINNTELPRVERLNPDGSQDPTFTPAQPDRSVGSVALQPDGKIVLGGSFNTLGGTEHPHISRLNPDGSLDQGFNPGSGAQPAFGRVNATVVLSDGRIVIGGLFTSFDGIGRNRIARLGSNGTLDPTFDPGVGAADTVTSIAVRPDGTLLIAGGFTSVGGMSRVNLAQLSNSGAVTTSASPFRFSATKEGIAGGVHQLLPLPDGTLLLGGFYSSVNGIPRTNFARLNPDATLDTLFAPNLSGGGLSTLLRQPDGKLVIAGTFSAVNGISRARVARLQSNGSLDTSFNAGTFVDFANGVSALTRQPDGQFLIGGYFSSINGTARSGVARLSASGALDGSFNPILLNQPLGPGTETVFAKAALGFAVQPDGGILMQGAFTSVDGITRAGFARLNASGTLDLTFNPSVNGYGGVGTFAVQTDGRILIAGDFSLVNGFRRTGIARLMPDGSLDHSFVPAVLARDGDSFTVSDVVCQPDGKILLSGWFASVDGTPRAGLARLDLDGSLDTGFDAGTAHQGNPVSLAWQPDGKIVVGGSFSSFNDVPRGSVARLFSSPPSLPPSNPFIRSGNRVADAGQRVDFEISAEGTLPQTYQWRRNGAILTGATNYCYSITSAAASHAGNYSVLVGNSFGSALTTNVTLLIPPTAYTNSAAIQLPVGSDTAATYPSQLTVSGFAGPVDRITVTLDRVSHGFPSELAVLLVGPGGQTVGLMSIAGGISANAATNVTLTFDDLAGTSLGTITPLTTGSYRPSNLAGPARNWPAPAPPGPHQSTLATFLSSDLNGVWSLYVSDDYPPELGGSIGGGWRLNFHRPVPPTITLQPQSATNTPCGTVTFTAVASGDMPLSYQWLFDDVPIPGAVEPSFTLPDIATSDDGLYSVVVTNRNGSATSALGLLTVTSASQHNNFACREMLSGTNEYFYGGNYGATAEPGEPSPSNASGAGALHSLWYRWTAPFAGGVILEVNPYFDTAAIAIYTNRPGPESVTNLDRVADNSSFFGRLRCAFTAVAGREYAIAIDGTDLFGGTGIGDFNAQLTLTPPPLNDQFANATVIDNAYFAEAGSFLGASRETAEADHGDPSLAQTLWWTWTAPTNAGTSFIPVRLVADAVSFPPAIAVYTGTTVGSLTPVPSISSTNSIDPGFPTLSMTRETTFDAIPGTTYHIALAGIQHLGNVISPRFGNFRFRFNTRILSLSVANMTAFSGFGGSSTYVGSLTVSNLSPRLSRPLRLIVSVGSGVSVQRADLGYTNLARIPQSTENISPLPPNGGVAINVNGTIPETTQTETNGIGWGVYAELQEQLPSGAWLVVDQTLIGFRDWPGLNDSPGPGGGVIRLDPGYVGALAFNPLRSVAVLGPAQVPEGSSLLYGGRAHYADSTTYDFSNTLWTASLFFISSNGLFITDRVTADTPVQLDASYESGGLIYHAVTNIIVGNLPPPNLGNPRLTNDSLFLELTGVPGRPHQIRATDDVTAPFSTWPVLTNLVPGANATAVFLESPTQTGNQRFFGVEER